MNQAKETTKGLVVLLDEQGIVDRVCTEKFHNGLVTDLSQIEKEYGEIELKQVLSDMREEHNIEDDHAVAGMFIVHLAVLQTNRTKKIDTGFWIVIDSPDRLVVAHPSEQVWQSELSMFSSHKGPYDLNAMFPELGYSATDAEFQWMLQEIMKRVHDARNLSGCSAVPEGEHESFLEDAKNWERIFSIAKSLKKGGVQ